MPFSPILNAKELLPWQIYVLITDELCYILNIIKSEKRPHFAVFVFS